MLLHIFAAILFAFVTLTSQQQSCNDVPFDPELQICCDGKLIAPSEGISAYFYGCCGGRIYRSDQQMKCCNDTLLFDTNTQFCYKDEVLRKSDADSIFQCGQDDQKTFGQFSCCGGNAVEIDRFEKLCCDNKVIVNEKGPFYYPQCCGPEMIFRVSQICCELKSYNFTVNEAAQCCGDKKYDMIKETCDNGEIHPKSN